MKIKSDFITNSSSSSFLVVFDEFPETVGEMKKVLFGNREEYQSPFDDESYWKTDKIAEVVLNDLNNSESLTSNNIIDFFEGFHDDELYNSCVLDRKTWKFDWNRYEEEKRISAKAQTFKFLKDHMGKKFAIFEYSDNDGPMFSAMEHGNLFKKLEHIRRSNH